MALAYLFLFSPPAAGDFSVSGAPGQLDPPLILTPQDSFQVTVAFSNTNLHCSGTELYLDIGIQGFDLQGTLQLFRADQEGYRLIDPAGGTVVATFSSLPEGRYNAFVWTLTGDPGEPFTTQTPACQAAISPNVNVVVYPYVPTGPGEITWSGVPTFQQPPLLITTQDALPISITYSNTVQLCTGAERHIDVAIQGTDPLGNPIFVRDDEGFRPIVPGAGTFTATFSSLPEGRYNFFGFAMTADPGQPFTTQTPTCQAPIAPNTAIVVSVDPPPGHTPAGSDVTVQSGGVTLTFSSVVAAGATTVTPTVSGAPGGFAVADLIAYEVSSTARFTGSVTMAFVVPGPMSEPDFNSLSVIHDDDGVLVDVTASSPSRDYATMTIYAITTSFSPFHVVRKEPHTTVLFDRSKAYKKGSTVPIKVQLRNAANANLSSPGTLLAARDLRRIGGTTSAPLIDSGHANPDDNFRYDSALGGDGGYVFNLSTKALSAGTYVLSFYAGSNHTFFYTVEFEIR